MSLRTNNGENYAMLVDRDCKDIDSLPSSSDASRPILPDCIAQIDSFSMRFRVELNEPILQNDRIQIRAAVDRQFREHHQLLMQIAERENIFY